MTTQSKTLADSRSILSRIGIFCLPTASPHGENEARSAIRSVMRDIKSAEMAGFGFAWIAEHHTVAYGGSIPDPLTLIAAVGQHVSSISLGSCMTLAPLRSSALIAQQAQLVTRLVPGTLHLGLGRGFLPCDTHAFGLSQQVATERFWGTVQELAEMRADPQWVKDIWVATTSAEGAATVGRLGLGLALNPYTRTDEEIDTSIEVYRDAINHSGNQRHYRVLVHEPLYLADDYAVARTVGSKHFQAYLAVLQQAAGRSEPAEIDPRHRIGEADYSARCAFLSEPELPERLSNWQARGATHWCFLVRFGKLSDAQVLESITRCARAAARVALSPNPVSGDPENRASRDTHDRAAVHGN